jgi:hypothetical protein
LPRPCAPRNVPSNPPDLQVIPPSPSSGSMHIAALTFGPTAHAKLGVMRRLASSVFAAATLLSPPALAATSSPTPPAGGAAVSADGKVAISAAACTKVLRQARQGADYVPGIDVNGRPVAPADLPSDGVATPSFTIVLDADLRRRYGISSNARLFRPGIEVGDITVEGNKVLFNGVPLASEETALLLAQCRAHGFAPQ